MSGIVGILNRDGQHVDRPLLRALTDFLSFRGPDEKGIWASGEVGFGHTMLRTTYEAEQEKQPAVFQGRFFITADVRLDQRLDLMATLEQAGIDVPRDICDPDLILHSYAAWGEECVDHLRGDFSFAIWDARERKLFCARDHFGVKPFYYVDLKDAFVLSNTLDCLRAYPDVSDELNDEAIADFLLFGLNCDLTTTTFRDIRRLPGAHTLTVSSRGIEIRRYWMPPIDGRIRYKRDEEYVENFLTLFRQSVSDRLRTDRVGISMSGGLDSTSIAAIAKEVTASFGATKLRASTIVFDSLIPDDERHYAGEAATFLGLPIDFVAYDRAPFFAESADITSPEPIVTGTLGSDIELYKALAAQQRVLLAGDGPDNLMDFQMWPYLRDLAQRGEWPRFAADGAKFLWIRPFPWRGIRARLRSRATKFRTPSVPAWFAPQLAERVDLVGKLNSGLLRARVERSHPVFPRGYASLFLPHWLSAFESEDPGFTRSCIETRFPFLDLRIVDFFLAIPSFPWAFQKRLLRHAMRRRLPNAVLARKKTPLAQDPSEARLKNLGEDWIDGREWHEQIGAYVDRRALMAMGKRKAQLEEIQNFHSALALNFWLRSSFRVGYKLIAETRHA